MAEPYSSTERCVAWPARGRRLWAGFWPICETGASAGLRGPSPTSATGADAWSYASSALSRDWTTSRGEVSAA
jgi:hypothetical protein